MPTKRIPAAAIDARLSENQSEKRRLLYQLQLVNKAIQELRREQRELQRKPRPAAPESGAKRGPGRPRKDASQPQAPAAKRGPGRPRKNPQPAEAGSPVKRPPGRPRKDGKPAGSVPKGRKRKA